MSYKLDESWFNGKDYSCPICNKSYSKHGICNHIYRAHLGRKYAKRNRESYDKKEYREKISSSKRRVDKIRIDARIAATKIYRVWCHKCGAEFEIRSYNFDENKKWFCSSHCAHSRDRTWAKAVDENGQNIFSKKCSDIMKKKWLDPSYSKAMIKKCKRFSSKSEEYIRKYFQKNFPNDKWTFGGGITYNNFRLVRDMYSKKLKINFEYDGIWHFKNIHCQLEDKQNKDLALEKWTIENGWRLIRISDSQFLKDKEAMLKWIVNEVYNGKEVIVKYGDEYNK